MFINPNQIVPIINKEIKIVCSKGGKDKLIFFKNVMKEFFLEYKEKKDLQFGEVVRGKY